jgi:hypothetical protein
VRGQHEKALIGCTNLLLTDKFGSGMSRMRRITGELLHSTQDHATPHSVRDLIDSERLM